MRRLAEVLDVPDAFFYLPVTETHEGFFRSLRRTSVSHRRRARAIAHVAHDVAQTAGANQLPRVSIPCLPVADLEAPRAELEDVAAQVRAVMGLPTGPVPDVVQTLEDHGLIVIRLPLDTADVDAFSLPFNDRPVVVLGTDKNDRARSRFDAAHELGHLVAHGEHVWGVKQVEQQAHSFAAAFLMPADDIMHELPTRADWPRLFDLKRKWQVSLGALLMRARNLGRMSESQYLTAVKAASARGWRRVEPVPLGKPEQPSRFARLLATSSARQAATALPADIISALVTATEL
jgi:Zn-dependent peptidase ImmA (M78 family)